MNHSTKLSRRSLLIMLSGTLAATIIVTPSKAAKNRRNRGDRYYPRPDETYPTPSSPAVPTPPPAPEPYRPTSPAAMLGVGGSLLGGLGFLGAWLMKMNQKSSAPAPSPPAPRIKPVKQAAPEVADWYVFRSGKAEGPYTALQLWEVQKITARTKVRRGEAEWQKAGEVSELAKYLSKK